MPTLLLLWLGNFFHGNRLKPFCLSYSSSCLCQIHWTWSCYRTISWLSEGRRSSSI